MVGMRGLTTSRFQVCNGSPQHVAHHRPIYACSWENLRLTRSLLYPGWYRNAYPESPREAECHQPGHDRKLNYPVQRFRAARDVRVVVAGLERCFAPGATCARWANSKMLQRRHARAWSNSFTSSRRCVIPPLLWCTVTRLPGLRDGSALRLARGRGCGTLRDAAGAPGADRALRADV